MLFISCEALFSFLRYLHFSPNFLLCRKRLDKKAKFNFKIYDVTDWTASNYKTYPVNIYLLKVSNRNTRKRCEIWSKLTIKTPERRHSRRSGVSFVNFEHIFTSFSSVSIVDFEQVNVSRIYCSISQEVEATRR